MGRLTEYFGHMNDDIAEENGRFLTLTADQKRRGRREHKKGLKATETLPQGGLFDVPVAPA